MFLGDFEKAWAESDAIAARGGSDPHRFWDGHDFAGKRVILRCLHGLGDTVQFIRLRAPDPEAGEPLNRGDTPPTGPAAATGSRH